MNKKAINKKRNKNKQKPNQTHSVNDTAKKIALGLGSLTAISLAVSGTDKFQTNNQVSSTPVPEPTVINQQSNFMPDGSINPELYNIDPASVSLPDSLKPLLNHISYESGGAIYMFKPMRTNTDIMQVGVDQNGDIKITSIIVETTPTGPSITQYQIREEPIPDKSSTTISQVLEWLSCIATVGSFILDLYKKKNGHDGSDRRGAINYSKPDDYHDIESAVIALNRLMEKLKEESSKQTSYTNTFTTVTVTPVETATLFNESMKEILRDTDPIRRHLVNKKYGNQQ